MDIRALRVFVAVADSLSFTRASDMTHMSVSAVSRTIARLEDEVGQRLLERDRRSVRLSRAGQAFRQYARRTLADWQQLQRDLSDTQPLAGEVSLYCSVTASYSVLAPVLDAFRDTHPGVDIMLHTGDQADGIDRVLDGHDDLAISGRPRQLASRLAFLPLLDSPLEFCMPAAHCQVRDMLLRTDPAAPDFSAQGVPFIVPERGITKELLEDWFASRGIQPSIYAQVAGHEAIVAMVALGLGVGIAPKLVIEASGLASSVDVFTVADPLPALTVGLCGLQQRLRRPLVRSLWDVAASTYRIGS